MRENDNVSNLIDRMNGVESNSMCPLKVVHREASRPKAISSFLPRRQQVPQDMIRPGLNR